MELTPLQTSPRPAQRSVQLVLVRANGPLFYSLAAASLLEADMPLCGGSPAALLRCRSRARAVVEVGVAAAQSGARGDSCATTSRRRGPSSTGLRAMSSIARWPSRTAGGAAAAAPASTKRSRDASRRRRAGCSTAVSRAGRRTGVCASSRARWPEEEALSFSHFRHLYDRRLRTQGLGCAAAWTTALGCVRAARDSHVPRAFNAISAQCAAQVPFPVLDYPEFLARMGAVIERHGDLGTPERILFRPWKGQPARARRRTPQSRGSTWFNAVFRRAA